MQKIKYLSFFIVLSLLSLQMMGQSNKALIIGNHDYIEFADLRFSINKCDELKSVLLEMGYEVTLVMNANRAQMLSAIDKFYSSDALISLFYYSGHIHENASDHKVYLVPVDARVENQYVAAFDLISLKRIEDFSSSSDAAHKILVFDAVNNSKVPEIREKIQLAFSSFSSIDDAIVLSNHNLQDTPEETSYLLEKFLDELGNPQQTIQGTFEALKEKSVFNPYLNLSINGRAPDLPWNYKLTGSAAEMMPSFPFPPPRASASHALDRKHFANAENLFEVGEILNSTLKSCGYFERSYYQIPEGFALVTRIEKIELDATPCSIPDRWNAPHDEAHKSFSIKDYFRSLFYAKKGKYRILVFLVTSIPFHQSEKQMSLASAQQYLKSGYNSLPTEFASMPFTDDYNCTALIYEFDKVEYEEGVQVETSKFQGYEHLRKNNFLPILNNGNK